MIRVYERTLQSSATFWARFRFGKAGAYLVAAGLLLTACGEGADGPDPSTPTLYEGARLIPGDGSPPIDEAAFLVEEGVIVRVGQADRLRISGDVERIDLTGRVVVPALVGAHAHPGFQDGLDYAAENHSAKTLRGDLERAAHFGVGTVVSLGIDPGEAAFALREETADGSIGAARLLTAGRGIGAPDAGPGLSALAEGIAFEVETEEGGREAVRELAGQGVDLIKIWVDDRGGRAATLEPPVYRAIIDEARRYELAVAAHVYDHADAEALVEAGVHALAHLPRDREVSDELVAEIVSRGVYVMPNLGFAERGVHTGPPGWLESPELTALLEETTAPEVIERMREAYEDRDSETAASARERYEVLERSLAKLYRAGAWIVLGADSGLPDHLVGHAEQRELELMVAAGMSPAGALQAATGNAGRFLGRTGEGSLRAGSRADFVVLDADPLDDIRNTRRVEAVYLGGYEIER